MDSVKIVDLNSENILEYGICGYKSLKRPGFPEKVAWFRERRQEGMKIKILVLDEGTTQGMIEYVPGEFAWRPVKTKGYMFIHCIFVGFKRKFKGKGYASLLVEECIKDARKEKMQGVAVVTRKGSFMVDKTLFLKKGFEVVDKAAPDFEMLVKKFNPNVSNPQFRKDWEERLKPYQKGLTIIRAYQCPYTVKNVSEISELAEKEFNIKPKIVTLKDAREAQNSPCPFGIFCIVYNGKVIGEHPISSTRFSNIMNKILQNEKGVDK